LQISLDPYQDDRGRGFFCCRNRVSGARVSLKRGYRAEETTMGRGLLLWLIGIPLPIILVVWLLGGLG
jgi:hypothetical protein